MTSWNVDSQKWKLVTWSKGDEKFKYSSLYKIREIRYGIVFLFQRCLGLFAKNRIWLQPYVSQLIMTDDRLSRIGIICVYRTPGCFVLQEQHRYVSCRGTMLTRQKTLMLISQKIQLLLTLNHVSIYMSN